MEHDTSFHCQLTINSTHVFLTSGLETETLLLNWETQEYTNLFHIPTAREHPACGVLNNEEYGLEVLVAAQRSSFIYSFRDLLWREGPKLPVNLSDLAYAPTSDGFLAVAGEDLRGRYTTLIYRFDETVYEWYLEEAHLEEGRSFAAAVALPEDFAPCY